MYQIDQGAILALFMQQAEGIERTNLEMGR